MRTKRIKIPFDLTPVQRRVLESGVRYEDDWDEKHHQDRDVTRGQVNTRHGNITTLEVLERGGFLQREHLIRSEDLPNLIDTYQRAAEQRHARVLARLREAMQAVHDGKAAEARKLLGNFDTWSDRYSYQAATITPYYLTAKGRAAVDDGMRICAKCEGKGRMFNGTECLACEGAGMLALEKEAT